jgi:hypothetical protein
LVASLQGDYNRPGRGETWTPRELRGLTIGNLLTVEAITADGQVVVASAEHNQDMFRALRGGNFGVAASFECQAHPVAGAADGMDDHAE